MINNMETIINRKVNAGRGLDNKISVYIPGTVNRDAAADNTEYVKTAAAGLSRLFGGATATAARGSWIDDDGNMITENITIVYAYASDDDATEENINQVASFGALKN